VIRELANSLPLSGKYQAASGGFDNDFPGFQSVILLTDSDFTFAYHRYGDYHAVNSAEMVWGVIFMFFNMVVQRYGPFLADVNRDCLVSLF
jgi:hypothetical protein